VLLVLVVPAVVTSQDAGSNSITGIKVSEEATETVVTITASRTPTFSVFKLDDPVRLFVDVNQGEVSKVAEPIVVDNGILDQVGTLQFKSSGVPMGRIIIGLRQDVPYDVKTVGNGIVVHIDAAGRRASTAEAGALARQVSTVREELKHEQELLRQLREARERDQALKIREDASRIEAERLRLEATRLQAQAQRDAAEARGRADADTRRAEEMRLKADEAARVAAERTAASERQLQALKAQSEAAVRTEQDRLAAVRVAREAEEANRAAQSELTKQERIGLEQARSSRQREEKLLAELTAARKQEAAARSKAAQTRTEAENLALAKADQKVRELEATLAAQRTTAAAEASSRDDNRRAAEVSARSTATELAAAKARSVSLEKRLAEVQAEREALAVRARTAEDQARQAVAREQKAREDLAARTGVAEADARKAAEREKRAGADLAAQTQIAVKTEQDRLVAVRAARDAEDANRTAQKELAKQESDGLAQARTSRQNEEKLLAELNAARKLEVSTRTKAAQSRTEAENLALARVEQKVRELEETLAAQRAKAASEASSRDESRRAAEISARNAATELAAAKARSGMLEKRLAEVQAEHEALAARARTAENQAQQAQVREEKTRESLAARTGIAEAEARKSAEREQKASSELAAQAQIAEDEARKAADREQKNSSELATRARIAEGEARKAAERDRKTSAELVERTRIAEDEARKAAAREQKNSAELATRARIAEDEARKAAERDRKTSAELVERTRIAEDEARKAAAREQKNSAELATRARIAEDEARKAAAREQKNSVELAERARVAEDKARVAAEREKKTNAELVERTRIAEEEAIKAAAREQKTSAALAELTRTAEAEARKAAAREQKTNAELVERTRIAEEEASKAAAREQKTIAALAELTRTAEAEARKAAAREQKTNAELAERTRIAEEEARKAVGREQKTSAELAERTRIAEEEARKAAAREQKTSESLASAEAAGAQVNAAYGETTRRLAVEEGQLALISSQRLEAERAVAEARQQIQELQVRREAELAALRQELAAARAQTQGIDNAKIASLAQQVSQREREVAARDRELNELRADVQAARAESASKDATIRELTSEMAKARNEVAGAQDSAATKEKEVAALRSALQAEKAGRADRAEVERLQASLAAKERSLKEVQADLADRLARADALANRRTKEVSRLGEELQRLKSDRSRGESTEVARLKDRLSSREAEMQVLRKAYDDARKAGRTNKQEETRAALLKRKVEAQQIELKALRGEYQKEVASSKTGISQRDVRIVELARELDGLKASGSARESEEVARLKSLVSLRETELAKASEREAAARKAGIVAEDQKKLKSDLESAQVLADRARADMTTARAKEREALDREAKAASRIDELVSAQARSDKDLLGARAEASELARQLTSREAEVTRLQHELEDSLARSQQKVSAVQATAQAPTPTPKSVIRTIDFKSTRTGPTLVLGVDGDPRYEVSAGKNQWIMTISNATLPKDLERRMDVTAFESRVSMVSAFATPDGLVKIIAELARPVGQEVQVADGRLSWTFSGQTSESFMAGNAVTPATQRETPPARMVARALPTAPPPNFAPAFAPAVAASPMGSATAGTIVAGTGENQREYLKPAMVPKKKKYRGKRINLTVKDAEIHNVLTFLAREGKVNVVTSENVSGKVTFHLEDVPWDLALDTVLKAKGLDYVIEQGIYRVAPIDAIRKEYEAQVDKQKKVQELKPVIVRLLPVNYSEGDEMVTRLQTVLSPKGSVSIDSRTNTLIIKDTEDYLEAAEDLVRRLDQQTAQILIEARIVEARTTFTEDIGIQWGGKFAMASAYGNETGLAFPSSIGLAGGATPAGNTGGLSVANPNWAVNLPAAVGQGAGGAIGLQLGSIGGAGNLTLRLSAAESTGDVKIISSPRISTLDNRKARIQQGVSIPISVVSAAGVNTQFFSADLSLDVTPHVTRDGHIKLKLDITKNEPDFGNTGANGNPTIQKKEAHTELMIRDGDTTVIGGIYTRTTSKSYKKIPLLGDIPILGWLFKSRSQQDNRSELLIFITPKVVNREVAL
jgi:type IV pilus assembly protein PilQ